MEWLGPALVFYVAVASAVVARRRLAHVTSLRAPDVAALVGVVRSGTPEQLEAALSSAEPDSFPALILEAMLRDGSSNVRLAAVNEHFGDLDRELEKQKDVPDVIGRGSLLSGSFAGVLVLAMTVAGPSGAAWAPALASFLMGLAGFGISLQLGRSARQIASEARREWDRVGAAVGDRLGRGP